MRTIPVNERRSRLAGRHHLLAAARATVRDVAEDLVGLHATDPVTVYLAAAVRTAHPALAAVEQALYVDRSLVRITAMRNTLFALPVELAPVAHRACVAPGADTLREAVVWSISRAGIADDPAKWLADVEAGVLRVLARTGGATATELAALEPRVDMRVPVSETATRTSWLPLAVRILLLLAADGRVVRGRPQGSWTNGRYRWCRVEDWLPDGMTGPPVTEARVDVVRRWLRTYGPGTVADLKWWTGWTMREVRTALTRVGAQEVAVEQGSAYVLPDDEVPVPPVDPWVALLPALDPTIMGWRERDWYLGGHRAQLFDRNGNAGPTIWCDGRVVGGWAQRRTGEVALRLLEDIGTEATTAVWQAAEALTTVLGEARVTPRFRAPLERELAS